MSMMGVPTNVSSITFAISGTLIPVNNVISGVTDAEITSLLQYQKYNHVLVNDASLTTGTVTLACAPGIITSITINGQVYTPDPTLGSFGPVPAADSTVYLALGDQEAANCPFYVVQG